MPELPGLTLRRSKISRPASLLMYRKPFANAVAHLTAAGAVAEPFPFRPDVDFEARELRQELIGRRSRVLV